MVYGVVEVPDFSKPGLALFGLIFASANDTPPAFEKSLADVSNRLMCQIA